MESPGSCKVDRVVAEYDLHGADPRHESIHDGVLARWTGEDGHDEAGYRTLTAWFNRRLLRRVYDRHGRNALGGQVESDYDALTGDDPLRSEEVVESLRADGIDAEHVRDDMVSWGSMRTHLNDCLDGQKERTSSTDWERESVEMARSFAREKVDDAVSALANDGAVDGLSRASATVQVLLECEVCPTQVPFDVALDRGYVCKRHATGEGES